MPKQTFLKEAVKPKWIAGLLLALAVAAAFASLAQWQAERTFRFIPKTPEVQVAIPLSELAEPTSPFLTKQADRLVEFEATPMAGQAYVIKNRIQLLENGDAENGYWVVQPAITFDGDLVVLASGWFKLEQEALSEAKTLRESVSIAALQNFQGLYEPSEDPMPSQGSVFDSLSVPQLINQPGLPEQLKSYAGFVIIQNGTYVGERILIGVNPGENTFNWLTAFYAAEWVLFAFSAIFLWGRLVQDEVNRQNREGSIE
jgi:cytochrome oxidase assembly protein ShyY1